MAKGELQVTTSQNTLAALAELGHRILIVGCDPRPIRLASSCTPRLKILSLALPPPLAASRNLEIEEV